ncbi:hypothetical protein TNCV_237711 [Trichonephila clavipes]|nr:hypothetical protein TNCV_237711 [Trichonephila clavipes]
MAAADFMHHENPPTRAGVEPQPWGRLNVYEPTQGVVGNDAWSAEAYELEVYCAVQYPTVSSKLCVPTHVLGPVSYWDVN